MLCRRHKEEYNASLKTAAAPISPTAAAAHAAAAAALRPSSSGSGGIDSGSGIVSGSGGGIGSALLEDQLAAQHPAARLAAALEHQQTSQRPQQSGLSAPPGRLAGNAIAAALHSRQSPAGQPVLRPAPRPPVPEAPLQQQQQQPMPASRDQDTQGGGGVASVSGQEDVSVVQRLWLCSVCSWEGRTQAAALEHFQASRRHAPPCSRSCNVQPCQVPVVCISLCHFVAIVSATTWYLYQRLYQRLVVLPLQGSEHLASCLKAGGSVCLDCGIKFIDHNTVCLASLHDAQCRRRRGVISQSSLLGVQHARDDACNGTS